MRTKFLTLVALLVAGAVRAEVVLENLGPNEFLFPSTSTSRTIFITSNGSGQTLTFLKLFGIGNDTVRFSINGGAIATILSDDAGLFNLTTLTGSLTQIGTNTLDLLDLAAGYQQSIANDSTATAFGNSIGISGGSVDFHNSGYLRYELTAVPEPGTMLLGGIAAAVGGAGAWWKRRKQRRAAAEAAATPA